jgi:hypothetical protein
VRARGYDVLLVHSRRFNEQLEMTEQARQGTTQLMRRLSSELALPRVQLGESFSGLLRGNTSFSLEPQGRHETLHEGTGYLIRQVRVTGRHAGQGHHQVRGR